MTRILVTGAGGFIGSRLLKRALPDPSLEVLGLIDPGYYAWHLSDLGDDGAGRVRIRRVDLFDAAALEGVLREFQADTFVHLAATGLSGATVNAPDNDPVNRGLTLALLERFYGAGGKRFVFAGSWFEYGNSAVSGLVREDQACQPETEYARSKVRATEAVLSLSEKAGREAFVLRPFQTYGPAEHPDRLVPHLIRCALGRRRAECTHGAQARDFIYVDDVADAFLAAASRPAPSPRAVYNVCTGTRVTLKEMAGILDETLPWPGEREWGARETAFKEGSGLVGSHEAITRDLGWSPRVDLKSGLRETVEWVRARSGLYASLPPARPSAVPFRTRAAGETEPELSVLCPVFNEQENIPRTYERIKEVLERGGLSFELIFSDNCSHDGSWGLIEDLARRDSRVRGVRLSRNFGYQNSITNAMRHASGRAVAIIDADLQDPPEMILAFHEKWKKEGYDVIYGIRTDRSGEPLWRRAMMKIFYRMLNAISETPIPVDAGDFRLMDRRVARAVDSMPERDRYIRGMVAWAGFRQTGIPYVRSKRELGTSKFPFSKLLAIAIDGVVGFSMKPLRIAMTGAFTLILVGLVVFGYGIYQKISGQIMPGWASQIVALSFFFSFNFFILGIFGEYLGRVYREVKGRPVVIVDRKVGFRD